MKITLDSSQTHAINVVSPVKQSSVNPQKQETEDTIKIGQQAHELFQSSSKLSGKVEGLMKQRDRIQEMRSSLVEQTLEDGQDMSVIKEQLKNFDKQLREIEKELALEQMGKEEEHTEEKNEITESDQLSNATDSMIQSSISLQKARSITQVKSGLERTERTLKSEIKMDESRGVSSEAKSERLSAIEERLTKLNEQLAEQLKPNQFVEDSENIESEEQ